jgi:hypothetical protein
MKESQYFNKEATTRQQIECHSANNDARTMKFINNNNNNDNNQPKSTPFSAVKTPVISHFSFYL